MDKNSIIEFIKGVARNGTLSRAEVVQAYDQGAILPPGQTSSVTTPDAFGRKMSFSGVLYVIGACIVLIGIIVLISTNWSVLPSIMRILVSLGFAVVFFTAGTLLIGSDKTKVIGVVLHVLAAVLFPIGISITLGEYHIYPTLASYTSISAALAVLYGLSLYFHRNRLFTILFTIYGTWFVYVFIAYLIGQIDISVSASDVYEYVTLALGLCYILVGNGLAPVKKYSPLSNLYYLIGSIGVYAALMALSGWKPDQSYIYELIYILVVAAGMYLSVKWSARGLFIASALALFAFIVKITAEYFSDALGWPFALIIAGGLMIAAGFLLANIRGKLKHAQTPQDGGVANPVNK